MLKNSEKEKEKLQKQDPTNRKQRKLWKKYQQEVEEEFQKRINRYDKYHDYLEK